MPDDSDRLQGEIEEILSKIEHFPDAESRRARARHRYLRTLFSAIADRQRAVAGGLGRFSVSKMMLVSFLLILGSFFFRRFTPIVMNWVFVAGIVLFVSSFAILMFARGRGGGSVEQRWRSREIRYSTRRSRLAERLRRWWSGRRARRP